MSKIHKIEITFPVEVELTDDDLRIIGAALDGIASRYEIANPSRVMWSFGQGSKMLANPLMLSDDEPIPFDDSVYNIEMAEREAHPEEIARRKKRPFWTLSSALEQIESCGYECTGGSISNNQAWRWILMNFATRKKSNLEVVQTAVDQNAIAREKKCTCAQPHYLPTWVCAVHGEVTVPMD